MKMMTPDDPQSRYDIYYFGNASSFELNKPLPTLPNNAIAYIQNCNRNGEYLIPCGTEWKRVSRKEAERRVAKRSGEHEH